MSLTYAGMVNAYKLHRRWNHEEYEAEKISQPVVADYVVTHTVSWNDLDTASLIFGKNYASGGVDYTLRAPSVGSSIQAQVIQNAARPKATNGIRYWIRTTDISKTGGRCFVWTRYYYKNFGVAVRFAGGTFGPFLDQLQYLYLTSASARPEVLNADTLGADGLKAVPSTLAAASWGQLRCYSHHREKRQQAAPASGG
ncbi:MAG: hypothetical protein V8R13_08155 [Coprococcus sp.]